MKLAIVLTKFPDSNPFTVAVVDGSGINEKIQDSDKCLECMAREKIKEFLVISPEFKQEKFFINLYNTETAYLYKCIEAY